MNSISTYDELIKQIEVLKNQLEIEKSLRIKLENDLIAIKSDANTLENKNFQFRKAGNIGRFGYWELDLNDNLIIASETAKEIYGIEETVNPVEFIRLFELPEYKNAIDKSLYDLINYHLEHNIEYKIKRNDGKIIDIHSIAQLDKEKNIIFGTIQDITERKQLEELLRISNTKYQILFDTFPLGISITSKYGKIIESNKKAEELLGLTEKEQKDRRIDGKEWKIIKHDGSEFPIEEYASVIALKENRLVENVEMGIVKSDNSITWINVSAKPLNIKDYGVVITYNDISDKINIQKQLMDSESNMDLAQRMAKIGSWVWDLKTNKVTWSKGMFYVFDIDPKTYDGNPNALLDIIHPEDKEAFVNSMSSNLAGGYSPILEYRIIHRNGSIHSIFAEGYIDYDENGNPLRMMGTAQDITERKIAESALKESEERFRNMFFNAPIGIYRTNRSGEILLANPKLVQILGFDSFEDLQNRDIEYEGYSDSSVRAKFIEDIEKNGFVDNFEVAWKKKDGTDIFVNEHARCFCDEKGNPLYYEGTVIDISAKKIAEDELKRKNAELNELNITKDKFFSIIAHDLKNPIGNFKQFTALVYDSYKDFDEEELLQFLLLMKNSANNLYELLENLLDWSRAQRGKIQYNPVETNLHILVDNVFAINKLNAENKKIELINNIKLTTFIFADPNLINTILRNFVSNAIKFSNEGNVVLIQSNSNDGFINIGVSDFGVGIEPNRIDKLFRIDESESTLGTKNEKGTGLGLILCKEFIEMHNGKIWVESEVGKGSTFWISLPL